MKGELSGTLPDKPSRRTMPDDILAAWTSAASLTDRQNMFTMGRPKTA
ncbi:MAG TPA: hypothetical protein VN846_00595 [Candidatus Cybelea sp.]|nr:hypothetical protein [Candidatus Cybelea sp.]